MSEKTVKFKKNRSENKDNNRGFKGNKNSKNNNRKNGKGNHKHFNKKKTQEVTSQNLK